MASNHPTDSELDTLGLSRDADYTDPEGQDARRVAAQWDKIRLNGDVRAPLCRLTLLATPADPNVGREAATYPSAPIWIA